MDTKFEKTVDSPPSIRSAAAMIVAMGRNNEIGFKGSMPWHIPEDLRHFKQLTLGHPVIMGRVTWESLPKRPLPGRLNIVVSSHKIEQNGPDVKQASSIGEALNLCDDKKTPYIIGGGRVYHEFMPHATRLEVTRIDEEFPQADTFFPEIDSNQWSLVDASETFTSKSGLKYRFETYERSNNQ